MSIQTCYLIGGAPLSGKTTYAALLAAKHQATQISTDNIRDWMKQTSTRDQYPRLFDGANLEVIAFYEKFNTPEKVLGQQTEEGKDVAIGIEALLNTRVPWERLVIEGIAVTPDLARHLIRTFPEISFEVLFLYDGNTERIKERINRRGLWSKRTEYPEHIQEKELPWVILYNEFYKREAQLKGMQVVHVDSLEDFALASN